jgi:hypothetical protein
MTAITTLGVDNLSLRGAGTDYNFCTRLFATKAEADAALVLAGASGGWVPVSGKTNICFTADQGILKYDFSSSALVNSDAATRTYADTAIATAVSNLLDGAPGALNTLNELAAALNDDANAYTTLNNAIAAVQTNVDGNESDADDAIAANEVHIDNAATLSGVAKDSTHLATFTGGTIADNATVKAALQALETKVEAVQTDVDGNESDADIAIAANETHIDNAVTLTGVSKDSTSLGTFSGSTISDNGTIKAGVQELETAVETKLNSSGAQAALHVDHIITLSGVSQAADDLGTFTGSTINDNVTVKAALQALETKAEAVQTDVDGNESDADTAIALRATINSPTFTGTPAGPTASAGTNTTQIATTAFVTTAVANTIDGAPGALDTLNELAAALNDDASFSTTVTNLIAANEVHIDNAVSLTGVAKDSANLGTFTGGTIADSATIKAALQALETKAEAVQSDVNGNESDADTAIAANETHIDNMATLTGVAKDETSLATFTGDTISDSRTVKQALQEIETALEEVDANADNLTTAVGVAEQAEHMGTFSGSTITANGTAKEAIQELETAVETKAAVAGPTFTGAPAAPTASAGTNTTQLATTAFVKAALDALINGAPGALDTLNEIADAIADDANVAANLTTLINARATIAGPTFTGTPAAPTAAQSTNTTQVATTAYVQSNLTAALLRTAIGMSTSAGDPGDDRGVYFDSSSNKYLVSS